MMFLDQDGITDLSHNDAETRTCRDSRVACGATCQMLAAIGIALVMLLLNIGGAITPKVTTITMLWCLGYAFILAAGHKDVQEDLRCLN